MSGFKAAARGGVARAACACATFASVTFASAGFANAQADPRAYGHARPEPVYVGHPDAWAHPGAPAGLLWAAPAPVTQERYTYGRVRHNRPAASVTFTQTRQGPVPVALEAEYEIVAEPRSRHVPDLRDSRWR